MFDIKYLQADLNYTVLHYEDGRKSMHSYTLKRFEEAFEQSSAFLRTHRSYLVNAKHIISKTKNTVTLTGDVILPLARRRRRIK